MGRVRHPVPRNALARSSDDSQGALEALWLAHAARQQRYVQQLNALPAGDIQVLEIALEAVTAVLPVLSRQPIAKAQAEELLGRLEHPEEWREELSIEFRALLARAVRLRNSVLHGGPVAKPLSTQSTVSSRNSGA